MTDQQAAVRVAAVTKQFRDITAVQRLNLDVDRGGFFSILGPSGCGKTTTLRMIAGFERPDDGEIYLDGKPVTAVPPYHRNVNTVFQSYALFEHLSVWDNVAFGLRRKGLPKAEITKRVGEMIDLVHLAQRARAKPRQLSGGQQQRVALARALVNLPAVLLLDEPLGALDMQLRKQMQIELKHIQREVGVTFVYVTHDQEEALTMSDAIAVLNAGVLQQVGTPEEVYETPANTFVASFIGISNLLPATAEQGVLRLDSGLTLPAALPAWCGPGRAVSFCIRPEKIILADSLETAGQSGLVTVTGTIVESVYQGIMTHYVVELRPGARVVVVAKNSARAQARTALAPGAPVRLGWLPEHGLVLDREPAAAGS